MAQFDDIEIKKPVKEILAGKLRQSVRIVKFKGTVLIEGNENWEYMTSDMFAEKCYKLFGDSITKSRISDLEHLFRTSAPDFTNKATYIAFGDKVWDMQKLAINVDVAAEDCIYRVPYSFRAVETYLPFILDVANGNHDVYKDIMQSVAPLIMEKKPDGVFWYLGNGANGKSTLVHLIWKIFGNYLTELTVKQLEDERDTPQLNGKLGNVIKESSEGYLEDTRVYKSVGTHESFLTHKFNSQEPITVDGNIHHIFSANNIPTFGDKSHGARRRTLVIPFDNKFKQDKTFEDRTFTKEFIEMFIGEMMQYAIFLRNNNYDYVMSEVSSAKKRSYDITVNSAERYIDELISQDIKCFSNFRLLSIDYENWCADLGYVKLGIGMLRKSADDASFLRRSLRNVGGHVEKGYLWKDTKFMDCKPVVGRLGLHQLINSTKETEEISAKEDDIWAKTA